MKKLLFAAMAMILFSCSGDDSTPVNNENPNPVEVCDNVFEGNVWLKTQDEVDAFVAQDYCEINGVLSLGVSNDGQPPSDITDISGLSGLVKVSVKIMVVNTSLTSLNGLQNIKELPRLDIIYNASLTSIDASLSIAEGGSVYINDNSELTSIQGLVFKNKILAFSLQRNQNLTNLAIGGSSPEVKWLRIEYCGVVTLEGLETITEAQDIAIGHNANLVSLKGLENITKVGRLGIHSNHALTTIEHLSGITSIAALPYVADPYDVHFGINDNDSLQSLHGLENVGSYGGDHIMVRSNDNLTDLCAIRNMTRHSDINSENYDVSQNAYNPGMNDLMYGNCSQ